MAIAGPPRPVVLVRFRPGGRLKGMVLHQSWPRTAVPRHAPHGHTFASSGLLGRRRPFTSTSLRRRPRNPFGLDFATNGFKWDRTLCLKDSDGDGVSNGKELGDPQCEWRVGMAPPSVPTATLSHPGLKGVRMNELKAWWQLHKNASLAGTEQLETFVGVPTEPFTTTSSRYAIGVALVMAFQVPCPCFLGGALHHLQARPELGPMVPLDAPPVRGSTRSCLLTSITRRASALVGALHRVHTFASGARHPLPDRADFGYGFFRAQAFFTRRRDAAVMNTTTHRCARDGERGGDIADGRWRRWHRADDRGTSTSSSPSRSLPSPRVLAVGTAPPPAPLLVVRRRRA